MQDRMARIFISYSKQDSTPTKDLARHLTNQGHEVWWDTNIRSGESFREVIDRELDLADAVVVIWTPQSILSKWVIAETDHGDRHNKLITVRTADIEPWQIPKPYNNYHTSIGDDLPSIDVAITHLMQSRTASFPPAQPRNPAGRSVEADERLFDQFQQTNTIEAYRFYLE